MTEIMPFPKTIYCFIGLPLNGAFFFIPDRIENKKVTNRKQPKDGISVYIIAIL